MLNIAIWLVVGGVIGGVAGLLMRDEEDQAVFVNVLVGIVGALIAGWLVAPWVGFQVANPRVFSFGALAVALLGACALLGLMSVVRRRRP
jgi:uncharacterized membrane protein YeaQ/YmgE (transglycosylase-associated protein family)